MKRKGFLALLAGFAGALWSRNRSNASTGSKPRYDVRLVSPSEGEVLMGKRRDLVTAYIRPPAVPDGKGRGKFAGQFFSDVDGRSSIEYTRERVCQWIWDHMSEHGITDAEVRWDWSALRGDIADRPLFGNPKFASIDEIKGVKGEWLNRSRLLSQTHIV